MPTKPNFEPEDEAPQHTGPPPRGPEWMFERTRHRGEEVRYDGGTVVLQHCEHGRLRPPLRASIASEDFGALHPIAARLRTAAAHYASNEAGMGDAITDLCVVGRKGLAQLGAGRLDDAGQIDWARHLAHAKQAAVVPDVVAARVIEGLPRLSSPADADLARVEARARAVLAHLGGTPSSRALGQVGWVAVSSEDDLPHRPVNVGVTSSPQRTMELDVWGLRMSLRYAITGTLSKTSKNVLLLHGHSSRLEETEAISVALEALGYTVIRFDLPGCGHSSPMNHAHVLFAEDPRRADVPLPFAKEEPTLDNHSSLYVLRFLLASVRGFVEQLFEEHDLPPKLGLIAGGSLGGNLSLLISELAPHGAPNRHPWVDPRWSFVERLAAWSPAGLWTVPTIAHGTPHIRSKEHESPDRRRDTFNRWMNVDHNWVVVIRQAEQWYRPGWTGKARSLAEGWLGRHETYSHLFRTWHWIIAHEQVKFSHQHRVLHMDGSPADVRHQDLVGGRLLLMAGEKDNFKNTNIYDRVADLAAAGFPAQVMLWKETGHSIHDEYPAALTRVLDRFARDGA